MPPILDLPHHWATQREEEILIIEEAIVAEDEEDSLPTIFLLGLIPDLFAKCAKNTDILPFHVTTTLISPTKPLHHPLS